MNLFWNIYYENYYKSQRVHKSSQFYKKKKKRKEGTERERNEKYFIFQKLKHLTNPRNILIISMFPREKREKYSIHLTLVFILLFPGLHSVETRIRIY